MNIYNTKIRFLSDLNNLKTSLVVSKWLLDRTPFLFQAQRLNYLCWKESLANKLGVDSSAVSIVGSARLGLSLNPNKKFKPFDEASDVDIAIISYHHFQLAWRYLRNLGSKLYKLEPIQKSSIQDHRTRLIYWGTIATDKILGILPFGNLWLKALSETANISPPIERTINLRLYMDYESLKAYQVNNLVQLRNSLYDNLEYRFNE